MLFTEARGWMEGIYLVAQGEDGKMSSKSGSMFNTSYLVMETKAVSVYLRIFFVQTKPFTLSTKLINIIITKKFE
jgi:hypothetical protein